MRRHSGVPDGCPLTHRQLAVVDLLAHGLPHHQIATRLGISESAVRSRTLEARVKLHAASTAGVVGVCLRNGWLGDVPAGERSAFTSAYLDAFDEHLRSGSRDSRRAMRCALMGMQVERGVGVSLPRPETDPLDRLLRHILGRP